MNVLNKYKDNKILITVNISPSNKYHYLIIPYVNELMNQVVIFDFKFKIRK